MEFTQCASGKNILHDSNVSENIVSPNERESAVIAIFSMESE